MIPKRNLTQTEDVVSLVEVIGTYSLCLSLGAGPFSLRLGATVCRIQGPAATVSARFGTGSLTVEDVLMPQGAKDQWEKVPCCCWLRLCPAPEGITQALQPACLSRTEIFRAVKQNLRCGYSESYQHAIFLSNSYQKFLPVFLGKSES